MTEATIAEPRVATETLGPRFRLSGLMLLVLAAGLSLGVMSRAHVLVAAGRTFWESPVTRWLGVVMAPIGVVIGLAMAVQVFGRLDRRQPLRTQAWPIVWRLAAIASLGMLLAEESSLLPVVPASQWSPNSPPGQISTLVLDTRLRLLPVVEGLMAAGLVLGMRPRRAQPHRRRTPLAAWFRVALASLGGILIVAELMIIPYLVLIAVEAVENAKMHPGEGGGGSFIHPAVPLMPGGLAARLDGTIARTGLALLVVLITAGWLSSTLRRTDPDEANQGSWRDAFIGLALTVACLIAGVFLVFRALPQFSRWLSKGWA